MTKKQKEEQILRIQNKLITKYPQKFIDVGAARGQAERVLRVIRRITVSQVPGDQLETAKSRAITLEQVKLNVGEALKVL